MTPTPLQKAVVDYGASVRFYAELPDGTIPTRERPCPGTAYGKCHSSVIQRGVSRDWLAAIGKQAEGFKQTCDVDPKTGNTWHPRACPKCLRADP